MKRIAFNPNAIEYVECIAPAQYENFNDISIFNASVFVAHTVMKRGKRLANIKRDSVDFPILSSKENLKYWRANKPPRKNVDLTDINADRFEDLKEAYHYTSNTDCLSFCLRSLRVYTDKHGLEVITKSMTTDANLGYLSNAKEHSQPNLVRERFYIRPEYDARLTELAAQNKTSKSSILNQILSEALNLSED